MPTMVPSMPPPILSSSVLSPLALVTNTRQRIVTRAQCTAAGSPAPNCNGMWCRRTRCNKSKGRCLGGMRPSRAALSRSTLFFNTPRSLLCGGFCKGVLCAVLNGVCNGAQSSISATFALRTLSMGRPHLLLCPNWAYSSFYSSFLSFLVFFNSTLDSSKCITTFIDNKSINLTFQDRTYLHSRRVMY